MKRKMTSWMRRLRSRTVAERGQTATEYVMVIAVVVVAVVAASYLYLQPFQHGVNDLATDVEKRLGSERHKNLATSTDTMTSHTEGEEDETAGKASLFSFK